MDLRVKINNIEFKNPVIAASGCFNFGEEYNEIFDVSKLGGICSKGLTLNKKDGNTGLRVVETPSGMMNSIGLQNPGVDDFIKNELKKMKSYSTIIIANVGGGSIEEYIQCILRLNSTDVDMIELNISCPNVKEGGLSFGVKSHVAYDIVKKCKAVCKKPLMVKLSPNAEDIIDMAKQCEYAGADSLSLVNTFKAMDIDIKKREPCFDNIIAGLSGPCIRPIALRMVWEVSKNVTIPVIGLGGIKDYEDAIKFIMAGAHAIQVGTYNFINPLVQLEIIEGIKKFMERENIKSLDDIRGII